MPPALNQQSMPTKILTMPRSRLPLDTASSGASSSAGTGSERHHSPRPHRLTWHFHLALLPGPKYSVFGHVKCSIMGSQGPRGSKLHRQQSVPAFYLSLPLSWTSHKTTFQRKEKASASPCQTEIWTRLSALYPGCQDDCNFTLPCKATCFPFQERAPACLSHSDLRLVAPWQQPREWHQAPTNISSL